jgi:hypothetical protein
MNFKLNLKPKKKYIPEVGDIFIEKSYGYITGFYVTVNTAGFISEFQKEFPKDSFYAYNLESLKFKVMPNESLMRNYHKIKIESFEINEN